MADVGFWQQQWDTLISNTVPSLIFLGIGASAAWWFRGATKDGEINELKERVNALEERRQLALDKAIEREEARAGLEAELVKLKDQLEKNAPRHAIQTTSQAATDALKIVNTKTSELARILASEIPKYQPAEYKPAGKK
jgi:hypothetical protein